METKISPATGWHLFLVEQMKNHTQLRTVAAQWHALSNDEQEQWNVRAPIEAQARARAQAEAEAEAEAEEERKEEKEKESVLARARERAAALTRSRAQIRAQAHEGEGKPPKKVPCVANAFH